MPPRVVLGLAAALVLLALTPRPAAACLCGSTSNDSATDRAYAVFVGVVTQIDDPNWSPISYSTGDPIYYTFAVEAWRKNDLGPSVVVRSARDGTSCGLVMAIGERWLLYAERFEGELTVGSCGAHQRLAAGIAVPPQPIALGRGAVLPMALVAGLGVLGVAAFVLRRRSRSGVPPPSPGPR